MDGRYSEDKASTGKASPTKISKEGTSVYNAKVFKGVGGMEKSFQLLCV